MLHFSMKFDACQCMWRHEKMGQEYDIWPAHKGCGLRFKFYWTRRRANY